MTAIADRFGVPVVALASDRVARVGPDATPYLDADELAAGDVGVLVVGHGDEDIVSERDLVRALADRRDPDATCAGDMAHRERGVRRVGRTPRGWPPR
jgi:hypothetical protein